MATHIGITPEELKQNLNLVAQSLLLYAQDPKPPHQFQVKHHDDATPAENKHEPETNKQHVGNADHPFLVKHFIPKKRISSRPTPTITMQASSNVVTTLMQRNEALSVAAEMDGDEDEALVLEAMKPKEEELLGRGVAGIRRPSESDLVKMATEAERRSRPRRMMTG